MVAALQKIGNPLRALGKVRDLVNALVAEVEGKWSIEQRYVGKERVKRVDGNVVQE